MKVVEIVRSKSVTVKLPDYEATQSFVSMKATLDPDELDEVDPAVAAERLRVEIDRLLLADVARHYKTRGKSFSKQTIQRRYGLGTL